MHVQLLTDPDFARKTSFGACARLWGGDTFFAPKQDLVRSNLISQYLILVLKCYHNKEQLNTIFSVLLCSYSNTIFSDLKNNTDICKMQDDLNVYIDVVQNTLCLLFASSNHLTIELIKYLKTPTAKSHRQTTLLKPSIHRLAF